MALPDLSVAMTKRTVTYSLLLSLLSIQPTWGSGDQEEAYLQVYPPLDTGDNRTDIYFALMMSFGGDYVSIGSLPGIQIALDYINSEPSILPGYILRYTLTDSRCNRSMALKSLFQQLNSDHVKLGLVGSGCSVATEPTAEISQFFNIPQVSCVSSSSELGNRKRFPYYFQLLAAESQIAQGFFKIITNYRWKRVSLIIQNENLFTVTMDVLKDQLVMSGVEFTEKLFKTVDGIDGLSGEVFEPDTRIYVVAMYASHARDFLCKAYYEGIVYPKYLLITYGWYNQGWWTGKETSPTFNCTVEQRSQALAYSLAPRVQESYTNLSAPDVSGISPAEYLKRYEETVVTDENAKIPLKKYIPDPSEPFYYAQHCHEAILTFAFALNKTIDELSNYVDKKNATFFIENFTYNNTVFVETMFKHLESTSFSGLSGKTVQFDENGIREINVLDMYQYQWSGSDIIRTTVGEIHEENNDLLINYHPPFSDENQGLWPDGIPNDGIPIEDLVTVSLVLTIVYALLAVSGLVFAVVCVFFTLIFRNRKLIRLSSPNLNYIIGLGAIVLYLNIITLVIPTTNPDFAAVLCNINPWLTSLGYSLCYGTILAKTIRIWFIFNKPRVPSVTQSIIIKDYALALFVLCLVVIDVAILGIFTTVEGTRGELGVKKTSNKENMEDTIGPTCEIHQYYLFVCKSGGQVALFAVLFGYKGLLQVTALILAFNTRKVKVKGLDDSKYIAAAIYVTSIVLAVTAVSTYTLMDYVNIYPAVVGMGFLLGTTMILGLVFVPRMVGLYQDPQGDNIKISNTGSHDAPRRDSVYSPEAEIKRLRRRISELERSQQTVQTFPMESTVSVSNPDYMASSPSAERYQNHQLHICASSHDSTRDNPLTEARRSVVRWSQDPSTLSPV